MSDLNHPALLPAGLGDMLPPEAAHEAAVVDGLMESFHAFGYQRVKPPLIEYAESLLQGPGAALALQTFQLMDPLSQRLVGVRSDTTPQIARIATHRLGHAPRPLRLAYAGQVLRVRGSQLRPERQFGQVGCELIGSLRPEADAEVILAAIHGLRRVGVARLTVDLCVPTLVPALLAAQGVDGAVAAAVRRALDRKDAAAVAEIGVPVGLVLQRLLAASGPAGSALAELAAIPLPPAAEADRERLTAVVALVRRAEPALELTVDLVERRGFEYQSSVSFTLFSPGQRGELGRGGRYWLGGSGEPATGVSLYTDTVLRAAPPPVREGAVFVPHGAPERAAALLRAQGRVVISGLEPVDDARAEARRLGCIDVLLGDILHGVD